MVLSERSAPEASIFRLQILGALDLRDDHGLEARAILTQPRRLALLAYLAVTAPRGFQRRDRLLAMFWPEQDDEHARAALNRALYFVRQTLTPELLPSRGSDEVGVSTDLWSDVGAFEKACAEGRLVEALDLYQGDLLDGFFVSDAPDFDHWLDGERSRLRALAFRAARDLAHAEETAGDLGAALRWARWALGRNPYDEGALRELLALLDRAGDRASAVHAYEQFATRLTSELEVEPAPETAALIEAIRRRQARAASPESSSGLGTTRDAPTLDGDRLELIADEAAVTTEPEASAGDSTSSRRWTRWTASLVAACTVGLIATAVLVASASDPLDISGVHVTPFVNNTSDASLDPIGAMLSQAIRTDLSLAGGRDYDAAVGTDADSTFRRQRFGIDVVGGYYRVDGQLRFEAQVIDRVHGRTSWAIPSVVVPKDSVQAAVEQVRARVLGAVAALVHPRLGSWFPRASSAPTLAAFRSFVHARELQDGGQFHEATLEFERAAAADETFTWALMQAALSHLTVLEAREADAILLEVSRQRDRLLPLQLAYLDWLLASQRHDTPAEYLALERLAEIAPDQFLSQLVMTAERLNRPRKQVELLDRWRSDNPGIARTGFYWSSLAEIHHRLGHRWRENRAAARTRGYLPQTVYALTPTVRLAAARGRVSEVHAWLDSALSYPDGERNDAGTLMTMAAEELIAHGHGDQAGPVLVRAIQFYRTLPAQQTDFYDRLDLARTLLFAERLEEAESVALSLATGDADQLAIGTGLLGAIAARRGDRIEAEAHLARIDSLSATLSRPLEIGPYWQAQIRAWLGDNDEAIRLLRQTFGPQGRDLHEALEFRPLADDPDFQELQRPKG